MSPGIYTRNMQTGEFLEFNDRFKTAERYGAAYYTFHRADLLDALGGGLDRSAIHLGHRLQDWRSEATAPFLRSRMARGSKLKS